MKTNLEKNSIDINHSLHNYLTNIIGDSKNITRFVDLFWQQQKKPFQYSLKGGRCYSMLIRFALSLQSNATPAYEELSKSGILRLPSNRTLPDYSNYTRPQADFQRDVIDALSEIIDNDFDTQRYIGILIDEIKI